MSAHVEIRLIRGNFDAELASIRSELQNLEVVVPINVQIPREQILAAARARQQQLAAQQQMSAQQAGGLPGMIPPVIARDQGAPGVGVGEGSRYSGPLFGFGDRDPSVDAETMAALEMAALTNSNMAMTRGLLATQTNARFSQGRQTFPSDVTGIGFGGWALPSSTDHAPDAATWAEFFKSYFNQSSDPRFKPRGGAFGEGAGEGIDYGETFMHMASRTMEDMSVKVFGRPAMMLEDAGKELAMMAVGGPRGILAAREARKMRIEGEREYNRWLNREYLPQNAATMAEEYQGTIDKTIEEYQRAVNIFGAAAEGEMEVFSPSKRMGREAGQPIGEGIAEGISEGGASIKQSAKGTVRGAIQEGHNYASSAAQRTVTIEHRASSGTQSGGNPPARTKMPTVTHYPAGRPQQVQPVSTALPPRPRASRSNRASVGARMSMPPRRTESQSQPWRMENNFTDVPDPVRMDIESGINRAMRAMRQGPGAR